MKKIIILTFSILLFFTHLYAVYHTDWIELFESDIIELKVQNNLIYIITANEGLSIYFFEPDEEPLLISNYPDIITSNLIINGQYAFQINNRTISKYDINDPENLIFLGSFEIPNTVVENPINQIYIKNNLLCVASYDEIDIPHIHYTDTYIDIFDIQDISNILPITCIYGCFDVIGIRAKTHYLNNDNYLYVTPEELSTDIYDCNDFQNIHCIGELELVNCPILINESYVITYFSQIFQFNTYSTVTLIDDLDLFTSAAWQINNLILLNNFNGISFFYDLNENNVISHYYAHDQIPEFSGEFLFLAKDNILQFIDVRDPINYDELYHLDYNVHEFILDNDRIFFDINSGVTIVCLDNSQFPSYDVQTNYNDFIINNDMLISFYYHYSYTDFELFNIEDLSNPLLLNSFNLENTGKPFILIDNFIYCFSLNNLKIISVENPANPQIVNELNFDNDYYQAQFIRINSMLYLFGAGKSAFIDISDSLNPTIILEYNLPSNPETLFKVILIENIAYILPHHNDTILHIYDFNNPEDPLFIDTFDLSLSIDKMFKVDNKIGICTNDINSIYFYDIDNNIPYLSADYSWNNKTYDCQKYNDHLLVANGSFGISALSMSVTPIDDIELNQNETKQIRNFPNPFNPETTISFNLTAKEAENAEIVIYNVKGQKVKTLVNEVLPAGKHTAIWDGTDQNNKPVSSGIYFYKLEAGDFQKVKKMILIK